MSELIERIEQIARTPVLLVGSDYDGTISPIVAEPAAAKPHPEALVALRNLSRLPQTHVAVISGRSLRDLGALAPFPEDVHLVGSHGSEFDLDFPYRLPAELLDLRERLRSRLLEIAETDAGFAVEEKPGSLAFHYRRADPDAAQTAVAEIENDLASWPGVFVRHGKMVIELAVVETSKGEAVDAIRQRVGASAAVYFGDDETDEQAFVRLKGPDLAIKVGAGDTCAPYRVADTREAARLLAWLCELRGEWLESGRFVPIDQHSMLSDLRTIALVAPGGRIAWFCAPRIDSPALFGELLGGETAGTFFICPSGSEDPGQQVYRPDSLVLETRWPGITLTDLLDCSGERTGQRAGRSDLIRIVEGTGEVDIEFAPRFDFGRSQTRLRAREGGLEVEDTVEQVVLFSPGVDWHIEDEGRNQTAWARVRLDGEPLVLELRWGTGSLRGTKASALERREHTDRLWSSWVSRLRLPERERSLLARSALVLKGLTYGPSGAISAAATTSLPEQVGGARNWDYRFCWIRDAAMSAAALVRLGSFTEGIRFLDWMLGLLDKQDSPERLRPLYTVTAELVPAEATIAELSGYRGSRPVRIGNAAAGQIQLDVFGPVVELIWLLLERNAPLSAEHWRLVKKVVDAVTQRWEEPDHGIWEIRAERRHHVHSKVMCWVSAERACRISEMYRDRESPEWQALRDRIAEDVLANGWNDEAGAFTNAYGSPHLDAAALEIGLRGLLPVEDPRFLATVEAIERELRTGPVVYRYRYDDGLPGFEGGFHLCTSWLIQAYTMLGRRREALALFREMAALVGSTGLLSEEYGARTRRALGNHPQAYSHLGVIEAALALEG